MSSRRWTSIGAVTRHVPQGRIVGFSAARLPMVEFECEEVMPCVQFLANPRVVYGRAVGRSCDILSGLIRAFYEIQFYFASNVYQVEPREIWKVLPKKANGEVAGPLLVAVGNKSVHVYGFLKLHLDKFDDFVVMLRALNCVDQRYLDMALLKRRFTLRLTGKSQYGYRPVRPVVMGELAEVNTGRWGVFAEVDRRAYMAVTDWLYTTFMRRGFDVVVRV